MIKSFVEKNRHSIRLRKHNYADYGCYFVTLKTENKRCFFGYIRSDSMVLNDFGRIVAEEWEKTAQIRQDVQIDEYIIMPDHFHGIIIIDPSRRGDPRSPMNNSNLSPMNNSNLSPMNNSNLSPINNSNLSPMKNSNLSPMNNSNLSPINNSNLSPMKNSNLSPMNNSNIWPAYQIAPVTPQLPGCRFTPTGGLIAPQSDSLSAIISGFKSAVTRQINRIRQSTVPQVWQRNYYERIIRDTHEMDNIRHYIQNNPSKYIK